MYNKGFFKSPAYIKYRVYRKTPWGKSQMIKSAESEERGIISLAIRQCGENETHNARGTNATKLTGSSRFFRIRIGSRSGGAYCNRCGSCHMPKERAVYF